MKAKLEFDLNDPDERRSHLQCVHAADAYLALCNIRDELRGILKYGREGFDPATVEKVRDIFFAELNAYQVDLE